MIRNGMEVTESSNENNIWKHKPKAFPCIFCTHSYRRKDSLSQHLIDHLGQQSHLCSQCGETFNRKEMFVKHMNRHSEWDCDICHKRLSSKVSLSLHKKRHLQETKNGYQPTSKTADDQLSCDVCHAKFTTNHAYKLHINRLHSNKTVACLQQGCGKMFALKSDMLVHNMTHNAGKNFVCSVCHRAFVSEEKLSEHSSVHNGTAPFRCSVCDKGFTKKQQMEYHLRLHTGEKPYECHLCHARFRVMPNLRNHLLDHSGELPFQCQLCNRKFKRKALLDRHSLVHSSDSAYTPRQPRAIRSHTPPITTISPAQFRKGFDSLHGNPALQAVYLHTVRALKDKCTELGSVLQDLKVSEPLDDRCPSCSQTFESAALLEDHLLHCHDNEKPFICQFCNKSFGRNKQYKIHLVEHGVHDGDTSLWKPCPECGKWFSSNQQLSNHMITHVNKPPKRYECAHCSKGFSTRQYMIGHLKVHLGGTFYKCEICDKDFIFPHYLRLHKMRKHKEGKLEYVCNDCGKTFGHSLDLTQHLRSHCREKPYSCTLCHKNFKIKGAVIRHVITHFNKLNPITELTRDQLSDLMERIKGNDYIQFSEPPNSTGQTLPEVKPEPDESDEDVPDNVSDAEKEIKVECDVSIEPAPSRVLPENCYLTSHLCPVCGVQHGTKAGLEMHVMRHWGEVPPNCDICKHEFPNKLVLRRHILRHFKTEKKCRTCKKTFSSYVQLRNHDCPDKIQYTCDYCETTYARKDALRVHIKHRHIESKAFTCEVCGKGFARPENVRDHAITHTRNKPYQCHICHKSFSGKSYRDIHVDAHANPTKFNCKVCGAVFIRQQHLDRHMVKHSNSQENQCPICQKIITSKVYLQIHIDNHNGIRNFKCSFCQREFIAKNNLLRHLMTSHKGHEGYEEVYQQAVDQKSEKRSHAKSEKGAQLCPFCGKEYKSSTKYKYHLNKHTNQYPFYCDVCNKGCDTKSMLKKHFVSHTDVMIPCQLCAKKFRTQRSLSNHMAFHQAGDMPYHCKVCGDVFSRRKDLTDHLPQHAQNLFPCPVCGKIFCRRDRLNEHEEIHRNPNKHQCQVCGKAFFAKSYLSRHMLLHTDDPPNACGECGHAFVNSNHLKRHMAKHMREGGRREKPFMCRICMKPFMYKTTLANHMARGRHHPASPSQSFLLAPNTVKA